MSKVQPESWHVAMVKLHDLPTQLAIDQASVIFGVVVVHNEGVCHNPSFGLTTKARACKGASKE